MASLFYSQNFPKRSGLTHILPKREITITINARWTNGTFLQQGFAVFYINGMFIDWRAYGSADNLKTNLLLASGDDLTVIVGSAANNSQFILAEQKIDDTILNTLSLNYTFNQVATSSIRINWQVPVINNNNVEISNSTPSNNVEILGYQSNRYAPDEAIYRNVNIPAANAPFSYLLPINSILFPVLISPIWRSIEDVWYLGSEATTSIIRKELRVEPRQSREYGWICECCGWMWYDSSETFMNESRLRYPDSWWCPLCGCPKEHFILALN